MEETECFCGSARLAARSVAARDGLTGAVFTYHACAECGAERLTPRPDRASIGAYYPSTYASHRVRGNTLTERLKTLICRTYQQPGGNPLLRLLLAPLRGHTVFAFHGVEPRRIFEFGAATGNDLALFRDAGWEVSGCEPSARACATAAARGIVLENAPAETAGLAPASVSCVLINNVLEHVHDPGVVVAKAFDGLVPGGSLVIVVPNHRAWSARMFGGAWPGYDAPRHLWGFTPSSLSGLLRRSGFEAPIIHQRFQGIWAWSSSLDGRHSALPVAAWRQRWARPLALALLPLGVVSAILGAGDFLTVVARKPAGADPIDFSREPVVSSTPTSRT